MKKKHLLLGLSVLTNILLGQNSLSTKVTVCDAIFATGVNSSMYIVPVYDNQTMEIGVDNWTDPTMEYTVYELSYQTSLSDCNIGISPLKEVRNIEQIYNTTPLSVNNDFPLNIPFDYSLGNLFPQEHIIHIGIGNSISIGNCVNGEGNLIGNDVVVSNPDLWHIAKVRVFPLDPNFEVEFNASGLIEEISSLTTGAYVPDTEIEHEWEFALMSNPNFFQPIPNTNTSTEVLSGVNLPYNSQCIIVKHSVKPNCVSNGLIPGNNFPVAIDTI